MVRAGGVAEAQLDLKPVSGMRWADWGIGGEGEKMLRFMDREMRRNKKKL